MFTRPTQRILGLGAKGGAAAPVTLISDTFTDSDSTALGSHTIAPTNTPAASWTVQTGGMDIQSNRANGAGTGGANGDQSSCGAGVANLTVSCLVNPGANTDAHRGPIARWSDSNNFWMASADPVPNEFYLVERQGGTYTVRATASVTINNGTDYLAALACAGANLTATLDGANTLNYSSAFNQAATEVGVRGAAAGDRFDNFQVTSP